MAEIRLKLSKQGRADLRSGLRSLQSSLIRNGGLMVEEIGEIYAERVRFLMGTIHQGGPHNWAPLSELWLSLKKENQWTREIWEATGETKRAVQREGAKVTGSRVSSFSGIQGNETAPGVYASPISRAINTEFGLRGERFHNWPARPLFKPEALQVVEEVKEAAKGSIRTDIGRAVRRSFLIAIREAQGE